MVEGGFIIINFFYRMNRNKCASSHSNSRVSFVLAVVLSAGMKNK